jgi:hypothetical protein
MPSINNLGSEFPALDVQTQLGPLNTHECVLAIGCARWSREPDHARASVACLPPMCARNCAPLRQCRYFRDSWGIVFSHPK